MCMHGRDDSVSGRVSTKRTTGIGLRKLPEEDPDPLQQNHTLYPNYSPQMVEKAAVEVKFVQHFDPGTFESLDWFGGVAIIGSIYYWQIDTHLFS